MTGFLKICISIYILYHIEKAREKYRRATRHLGRGGGKVQVQAPPPTFLGPEKCIILNHGKTTLPIQNIFVANIYITGGILFSLRQICVGKIFNLYFRGKFCFCGEFFQLGEI